MFGIRKPRIIQVSPLHTWIEAWFYLAENLVEILSFGYLTTEWPDWWYDR